MCDQRGDGVRVPKGFPQVILGITVNTMMKNIGGSGGASAENKRSHIRKSYFPIIVTVGSFVISLAVAEVAYRIFSPSFSSKGVIPAYLGRYDPKLGWAYKPNACGISRATFKRVEYCFNSKGLRDQEIPYEGAPDEFRIVLLGDSRTVGFGVPIERHFSRIMEGYFRKVQVINMGIAGFGVDQMVLYYENEGYKYSPDLVVMYVPYSAAFRHMYRQMGGNPDGEEKPQFVMDGEELRLVNYPVARLRRGFSIHRFLRKNFGLYFFVTNRFGGQEASTGNARPSKEFMDKAHSLAARIIQRLNRRVTETGATLVVLNQVLALHKQLLRAGIPAHFIAPAMESGHTILNSKDLHPDEAGNGILAWELTRYLLQNGLIPEQHLLNTPMWRYFLEHQLHVATP